MTRNEVAGTRNVAEGSSSSTLPANPRGGCASARIAPLLPAEAELYGDIFCAPGRWLRTRLLTETPSISVLADTHVTRVFALPSAVVYVNPSSRGSLLAGASGTRSGAGGRTSNDVLDPSAGAMKISTGRESQDEIYTATTDPSHLQLLLRSGPRRVATASDLHPGEALVLHQKQFALYLLPVDELPRTAHVKLEKEVVRLVQVLLLYFQSHSCARTSCGRTEAAACPKMLQLPVLPSKATSSSSKESSGAASSDESRKSSSAAAPGGGKRMKSGVEVVPSGGSARGGTAGERIDAPPSLQIFELLLFVHLRYFHDRKQRLAPVWEDAISRDQESGVVADLFWAYGELLLDVVHKFFWFEDFHFPSEQEKELPEVVGNGSTRSSSPTSDVKTTTSSAGRYSCWQYTILEQNSMLLLHHDITESMMSISKTEGFSHGNNSVDPVGAPGPAAVPQRPPPGLPPPVVATAGTKKKKEKPVSKKAPQQEPLQQASGLISSTSPPGDQSSVPGTTTSAGAERTTPSTTKNHEFYVHDEILQFSVRIRFLLEAEVALLTAWGMRSKKFCEELLRPAGGETALHEEERQQLQQRAARWKEMDIRDDVQHPLQDSKGTSFQERSEAAFSPVDELRKVFTALTNALLKVWRWKTDAIRRVLTTLEQRSDNYVASSTVLKGGETTPPAVAARERKTKPPMTELQRQLAALNLFEKEARYTLLLKLREVLEQSDEQRTMSARLDLVERMRTVGELLRDHLAVVHEKGDSTWRYIRRSDKEHWLVHLLPRLAKRDEDASCQVARKTPEVGRRADEAGFTATSTSVVRKDRKPHGLSLGEPDEGVVDPDSQELDALVAGIEAVQVTTPTSRDQQAIRSSGIMAAAGAAISKAANYNDVLSGAAAKGTIAGNNPKKQATASVAGAALGKSNTGAGGGKSSKDGATEDVSREEESRALGKKKKKKNKKAKKGEAEPEETETTSAMPVEAVPDNGTVGDDGALGDDGAVPDNAAVADNHNGAVGEDVAMEDEDPTEDTENTKGASVGARQEEQEVEQENEHAKIKDENTVFPAGVDAAEQHQEEEQHDPRTPDDPSEQQQDVNVAAATSMSVDLEVVPERPPGSWTQEEVPAVVTPGEITLTGESSNNSPLRGRGRGLSSSDDLCPVDSCSVRSEDSSSISVQWLGFPSETRVLDVAPVFLRRVRQMMRSMVFAFELGDAAEDKSCCAVKTTTTCSGTSATGPCDSTAAEVQQVAEIHEHKGSTAASTLRIRIDQAISDWERGLRALLPLQVLDKAATQKRSLLGKGLHHEVRDFCLEQVEGDELDALNEHGLLFRKATAALLAVFLELKEEAASCSGRAGCAAAAAGVVDRVNLNVSLVEQALRASWTFYKEFLTEVVRFLMSPDHAIAHGLVTPAPTPSEGQRVEDGSGSVGAASCRNKNPGFVLGGDHPFRFRDQLLALDPFELNIEKLTNAVLHPRKSGDEETNHQHDSDGAPAPAGTPSIPVVEKSAQERNLARLVHGLLARNVHAAEFLQKEFNPAFEKAMEKEQEQLREYSTGGSNSTSEEEVGISSNLVDEQGVLFQFREDHQGVENYGEDSEKTFASLWRRVFGEDHDSCSTEQKDAEAAAKMTEEEPAGPAPVYFSGAGKFFDGEKHEEEELLPTAQRAPSAECEEVDRIAAPALQPDATTQHWMDRKLELEVLDPEHRTTLTPVDVPMNMQDNEESEKEKQKVTSESSSSKCRPPRSTFSFDEDAERTFGALSATQLLVKKQIEDELLTPAFEGSRNAFSAEQVGCVATEFSFVGVRPVRWNAFFAFFGVQPLDAGSSGFYFSVQLARHEEEVKDRVALRLVDVESTSDDDDVWSEQELRSPIPQLEALVSHLPPIVHTAFRFLSLFLIRAGVAVAQEIPGDEFGNDIAFAGASAADARSSSTTSSEARLRSLVGVPELLALWCLEKGFTKADTWMTKKLGEITRGNLLLQCLRDLDLHFADVSAGDIDLGTVRAWQLVTREEVLAERERMQETHNLCSLSRSLSDVSAGTNSGIVSSVPSAGPEQMANPPPGGLFPVGFFPTYHLQPVAVVPVVDHVDSTGGNRGSGPPQSLFVPPQEHGGPSYSPSSTVHHQFVPNQQQHLIQMQQQGGNSPGGRAEAGPSSSSSPAIWLEQHHQQQPDFYNPQTVPSHHQSLSYYSPGTWGGTSGGPPGVVVSSANITQQQHHVLQTPAQLQQQQHHVLQTPAQQQLHPPPILLSPTATYSIPALSGAPAGASMSTLSELPRMLEQPILSFPSSSSSASLQQVGAASSQQQPTGARAEHHVEEFCISTPKNSNTNSPPATSSGQNEAPLSGASAPSRFPAAGGFETNSRPDAVRFRFRQVERASQQAVLCQEEQEGGQELSNVGSGASVILFSNKHGWETEIQAKTLLRLNNLQEVLQRRPQRIEELFVEAEENQS
ncbi:unnamed protein product [Amoebophrya sp. A120]|nr:unnamed protein product [Amoebophrya sp. A120]|eukprot:GSA120T00010970001.1